MRGFLLFLACCVAGFGTVGQVRISGRVTDAKKKPLAGVSISIKDSYDGATSDSSGRFSFTCTEKGSVIISADLVGYRLFQEQITLGREDLTIGIILKEAVNEMNAVVITAGSFEAGDRKKATVLSSLDIVTTASANADITGALKTLPGAQQVGESEGLFVRGGTAAESKVFIDGSLVNNFFYSSVPNIAQRGRFSPFIFKGTVFSTGGYSALYGQALSSALILESIDMPEQSSANISLTVIGASGGYQFLDKKKRFSIGANYGYTNLSLAFALIRQRQDYEQVPVFHNADFNFRIRTSKTGMIKYYGLLGANQLKFFTPSIDTLGFLDGFAIKNFNHYHNLSYRESFGKWKFFAGASVTFNEDNIKSGLYTEGKTPVIIPELEFKNFTQMNNGRYANAKTVLERRLKGLSAIRFGTEYNYTDDKTEYTAYNGQLYTLQLKERILAVFGETDIYITNALAAKIGGRYEHSDFLDRSNIAPRLSLAYKLGQESQASIAYGQFYQDPERQYVRAPLDLRFAKATHYIAQFQRVSRQITFRAELFYKKYESLLKTGLQNYQQVATGSNGFGDARGFELFWRDKKNIRNIDYWVSYSFLDTKRDYLNYPAAIQPNFAARHTASLVVKKFVTPWKTQFNGAYNFASGRPYFYLAPGGSSGNFKITDQGITPDYHNVSFSVNFLPDIGKKNAKTFAVYVLSVSNVFGFSQVYNYQYSYNGYRKEAIVPPSRFFVFIGAFISFGIDRSQEAINSNL